MLFTACFGSVSSTYHCKDMFTDFNETGQDSIFNQVIYLLNSYICFLQPVLGLSLAHIVFVYSN